jgi:hypothetical protein
MDKVKIKNATKSYWNSSQNKVPEIYLKEYICERKNELDGKSLLEAELDWAKENCCITARCCGTLVLLVGFSLEPLLQSVCVHNPKKIVLLLNEKGYLGEEWQDFARHLTTAIENLKLYCFDGSKVTFLGEDVPARPGYPTKGDPASVFKTLVSVLHNEEDVVIDITGGKKSMVTGAFMYAAYAGSRISYVDFEEYDPKKRRPYGYGCKIGELSNPYEKFALHEWERVRTLYKRYKFRDARLLLMGEDEKGGPGTIIAVMQEYLHDSKIDKNNIDLQNAIQLLVKIICCYEDWDAGLYNEALEKARDIEKDIPDFKPPAVVTCLNGNWFITKEGSFDKGLANFYENTPEFQNYVYDELARIGRLIKYNHDYRSAFLRAGSLNEAVMLARLVKLVEDESKRKEMIEALQVKTPNAESVLGNLIKPEGNCVQISSKKSDISFKNAPEVKITIKQMAEWYKISLFDGHGDWKDFLHRRNDLAHKYYSPPRTWAEDALKFVTANVEDFWSQLMSTMVSQTTAMPWSKLIDICGISGYLPPNLR